MKLTFYLIFLKTLINISISDLPSIYKALQLIKKRGLIKIFDALLIIGGRKKTEIKLTLSLVFQFFSERSFLKIIKTHYEFHPNYN